MPYWAGTESSIYISDRKWWETVRLLPLLLSVYQASQATWEILKCTEIWQKGQWRGSHTQKTPEGMHLAGMCLKKVPGPCAATASCLCYSKAEQNKRERKKYIYKIRVSLTLRYSKCKINFNSCGGKFNKFGPPFSLRLRVINKVLRRT